VFYKIHSPPSISNTFAIFLPSLKQYRPTKCLLLNAFKTGFGWIIWNTGA
jgi:hypothetical protein